MSRPLQEPDCPVRQKIAHVIAVGRDEGLALSFGEGPPVREVPGLITAIADHRRVRTAAPGLDFEDDVGERLAWQSNQRKRANLENMEMGVHPVHPAQLTDEALAGHRPFGMGHNPADLAAAGPAGLQPCQL